MSDYGDAWVKINWETGAGHEELSERILRIINRAGDQRSSGVTALAAVAQVHATLALVEDADWEFIRKWGMYVVDPDDFVLTWDEE